MKISRTREIKEHQGRKSREKGDMNRGIVFLLILEKPKSFTELLKASELKSTKSLTNHLKKLGEDNLIEKAIKDGRVVYKLKIFDTQKIVEELEKDLFSTFIGATIIEWVLEKIFPNSYKQIHEAIQKGLTDLAINVIKPKVPPPQLKIITTSKEGEKS